MKPHAFLVICIALILAGGLWYVSSRQSPPQTPKQSDTRVQPTAVYTPGTEPQQNTRYIDYSKTSFDAVKNTKRILFFHASWCPTCRTADTQFRANMQNIPVGITVFKTDYDSSTDLKRRYNITYQHTYVLVDDEGNEIRKWNGGGIDELVAHVQ